MDNQPPQLAHTNAYRKPKKHFCKIRFCSTSETYTTSSQIHFHHTPAYCTICGRSFDDIAAEALQDYVTGHVTSVEQ